MNIRMAQIDRYCSLMGQGRGSSSLLTPWGGCILCVLVWHLMGRAGCKAAWLKSQSAIGWARATESAPSFAPSLGASLLLGARFCLLSRGVGLGRRELRPVSQHRMHDDRQAASQSDSRFAHR
jgi:hypothetical protein